MILTVFNSRFSDRQVLDSYRKDSDCQGNQRATARKYGIHRRQIQKWLQTESSLKLAVQQAVGAPKPPKIAAAATATAAAAVTAAVAVAAVETTSGAESDVNVDDYSDAEDSALDLSTTCLDLSKRKRVQGEFEPCKRRPLAPVPAAVEQPLYVNPPIGYPYMDYLYYYGWPPCCYRPCYVERPVPQRLTCSLDLTVYACEQKEPSLLDISYPPPPPPLQYWNKQDYRFSSSV